MLRDLLSSRTILAGIVFFVLMVGGTQLYRWHVLRTTAAALPQTRNTEPALETTDKTRTTPETKPGEFKPPGFVDTPDEKIDAHSTTATDTSPDAQPNGSAEGDSFIKPEPPPLPVSQDQFISPYGFGPYPELPEGYGPITWPRKSASSELMIRVRVKLLKEGVPVEGIVMSNGLVYPIIKGVRYVTWGETSYGKRYLRRSRGHPDDGDYLRAIANEKEAKGEVLTQADVPHIKLIPMEEGGIDPYTFLDLPK